MRISSLPPTALIATAFAFAAALATPAPARAQSTIDASEASAVSAFLTVVVGAQALDKGGQFIITGFKATGHGVEVAMRATGDGAQASIHAGEQVFKGSAIGVGSLVVVSVLATGLVLSDQNGHVFGFIPNAAVKPLIHSREIA